MSMRRSILGLALATGLFGLLACATHEAPGRSKGRVEAILARKELRVGLSADQPPTTSASPPATA